MNKNNPYLYIFTLILGSTLTVGLSVWATSIGNNISVTGTLSSTGALSITTTSATSTLSTGGLAVGTNQLVVIGSNGRVGIGTTTPADTLGVYGTLGFYPNTLGGADYIPWSVTNSDSVGRSYVSIKNDAGKNARIFVGGSSNTSTAFGLPLANSVWYSAGSNPSYIFIGPTSNSAPIVFGQGIFERMRIITDSTRSQLPAIVGIGTSSPFANLSVNGYAGGTLPLLAIATSTSLYSTSTVMIIDQNGNVGFGGTTTPAKPFSVTSDVFTTSQGTTTLFLDTTSSTKGSCIQFKSPSGSYLRLYATTTGQPTFEAGACQ